MFNLSLHLVFESALVFNGARSSVQAFNAWRATAPQRTAICKLAPLTSACRFCWKPISLGLFERRARKPPAQRPLTARLIVGRAHHAARPAMPHWLLSNLTR